MNGRPRRTLLEGGRIVTPDSVIEPGWVMIEGERIGAVGAGGAPTATDSRSTDRIDLGGDWVLPGFVDLHCHGGGGHPFTTGDPDAALAGAAFHLRHGTTTLLLGLVTEPLERLRGAVERLAEVVHESRRQDGAIGQIAGIHLEGPFLAEAACGAQNPRHMTDPSPVAISGLLEAGAGAIRMMTLAPERPGALDAIRQVIEAGVIAAIGHTEATFDEARAAIDAGATVATHLFNAMSGLHHREPGTVGAVLSDPAITAELILDGHHVHPAAASIARSAKGRDGIALITDAIAAAGTTEPVVELGGLEIRIADGAARLPGTGALAGSLLTMDRAVARAVEAGWSIVEVARMASTTPARLLGLDADRGSITVGRSADLVVLDPTHRLRRVFSAGVEIDLGGTPAEGPPVTAGPG